MNIKNIFLFLAAFLSGFKSHGQIFNKIYLQGVWRNIDYFNLRPVSETTSPSTILKKQLKGGNMCFTCEETKNVKYREIFYKNNKGLILKTYRTVDDGVKIPLPKDKPSIQGFKWSFKDSIISVMPRNAENHKIRVLLLKEDIMICFSGESVSVYVKQGAESHYKQMLNDSLYILPYVDWLCQHNIIGYKIEK
ncbi:MAG: hypothetical protein M3Y54_13645 [Bacteroidota bacterium]|nr:hypothetical protein [Bacteroidota bacterium]